MKRTLVIMLAAALVLTGCAGSWTAPDLYAYRPQETIPETQVCANCHPAQVASWKKYRHSGETAMEKIPVIELRACGACHTGLAAHAAAPENLPASITKMTKSEQNMVCGKCHYSQKLFGRRAINPHGRHALFADVALEGQPKQIGCLDCHSGHKGGADMLVRIRAHICYECHTSRSSPWGSFSPSTT